MVDDEHWRRNRLRLQAESQLFGERSEQTWTSGRDSVPWFQEGRRVLQLEVVAAGEAGTVGDESIHRWIATEVAGELDSGHSMSGDDTTRRADTTPLIRIGVDSCR